MTAPERLRPSLARQLPPQDPPRKRNRHTPVTPPRSTHPITPRYGYGTSPYTPELLQELGCATDADVARLCDRILAGNRKRSYLIQDRVKRGILYRTWRTSRKNTPSRGVNGRPPNRLSELGLHTIRQRLEQAAGIPASQLTERRHHQQLAVAVKQSPASDAAIAAALGCHRTTIWRLRNLSSLPGDTMTDTQRIERIEEALAQIGLLLIDMFPANQTVSRIVDAWLATVFPQQDKLAA